MQRVWPFIWVGLVFVAWFASPWLVSWVAGGGEKVGTFGDSFGALTSLFTGLAFVGLIITLRQQKAQIAMQREDLKLQRDEMEAARVELSGQKEQMELQNQSLKQQMFEQTFFNMLNLFNQYIADLVEKNPREGSEPQRGRDELERLLQKIASVDSHVVTGETEVNGFGFHKPVIKKKSKEERTASLINSIPDVLLKYSNDLNSYFRLLYNILKLVDQSRMDGAKSYTNILRAQLSDSELQLIALNCARAEAAKLQVFVDRYDILKDLPPKLNDFDIQAVCDEIRRQEIEEQVS